MLGSSSAAFSLLSSIFSHFTLISVIDILIVAAFFYLIFRLIKGTRAVQITYGILSLVVVYFVSKSLQLNTLAFILQRTLTAILIAIPVVFQPELRSALFKLGRTKITSEFKQLTRPELEKIIDILAESCTILAKQKHGAIIVLSRSDRLKEYLEEGRELDANLSSEMLLTIFSPNTPLHDGAAIITGNKIKVAGAILPLPEKKFSYQYGTRHRAAIELSTLTDAMVIVVSEETGSISLVIDGAVEKSHDKQTLKDRLFKLLIKKQKTKNES